MASGSKTKTRRRWGKRVATVADLVNQTPEKVRNGWRWLGAEQWCPECSRMIPVKDWSGHQQSHVAVDGRKATTRRVHERAQTEADQRAVDRALEQTERKGRASRTKQAERDRRATQKPAPLPTNPVVAKAEPPDNTTKIARFWAEQFRRQQMAQGGNGVPTGPSGLVARGFEAWAGFIPQTREDMEAHLLGMTAALGLAAHSVRDWAEAAIVGQKLHPAIAKPIITASDGIQEYRMDFTKAYVILTRIYRAAIEHAEQDGPKPQDDFWKPGG